MPLPALLPLLAAAGGGALLTGLATSGPKSVSKAITGTPGQLNVLPTLAPGQANIVAQAGQGGLDLLKKLQGQTFSFDPIAEQARTKFQTETVPSIAERFSSMGTGGSQSSSAFRAALGQAGSGLEQSLAALRAQYGLQERGLNQQLLSQLLGLGLTPSFQHYYQPGQQGALTPVLSALAGGLGAGIPGFFGGLFGGASNGNQLGGSPQPVAPQPTASYGGGMHPSLLSPNLLHLAQPYTSSLYGSF